MSEERRVRFWYGIFLSVFTVAIGILFLAEVADIYFGGGAAQGVFTAEIIHARFMHVLAPFILWILAIIAGFVLSVVFPVSAKRKNKPNAQKSLARLRRRLPAAEGLSEEGKADLAKVKKYELVRIILWSVSAAVCLAGAIACGVYVFDKTNFATIHYNAAVLDMAKFVLPFVVVSFACCIGTAIYEAVSAKYELPLVKKLVAAGGGPAERKESKFIIACRKHKKWGFPCIILGVRYAALWLVDFCRKHEKRIVLGVRIAVLVLAVVFIILGTLNGGMGDVFRKAVKICTECIGLG